MASSAIATDSERPNSFSSRIPAVMKPPNTATMIAAAAAMGRAVCSIPVATAAALSWPSSQASFIRRMRNTS